MNRVECKKLCESDHTWTGLPARSTRAVSSVSAGMYTTDLGLLKVLRSWSFRRPEKGPNWQTNKRGFYKSSKFVKIGRLIKSLDSESWTYFYFLSWLHQRAWFNAAMSYRRLFPNPWFAKRQWILTKPSTEHKEFHLSILLSGSNPLCRNVNTQHKKMQDMDSLICPLKITLLPFLRKLIWTFKHISLKMKSGSITIIHSH